jgi:hypothetical protein
MAAATPISHAESSTEIVKIDRTDITVEPWTWKFAADRRDEIDRYFATITRARSGVWNGRVFLLHRYGIRDGVLHGACFETDYASFLAWRDWDFPHPGVANVFAAAALWSADGACLVGEMAPSTASAGWLYFPSGTPDLADIGPDGALDLDGSLSRELLEETGLDIAEFEPAPGWTLVRDRGFVALLKQLTARQSADELRVRVMRHLARDPQAEFSDVRFLRGPADLNPRMPRFVGSYLQSIWQR